MPHHGEKSLQKVQGVQSIDVIFARKIAKVSYDDQLTNISKLQEATKNVGYPSYPVKDKE